MTSVTYTKTQGGTHTFLPFNMWTASTITRQDGRGVTEGTCYDYSGGLYNQVERRFRGFKDVTVTESCIAAIPAAQRPVTAITFAQDPPSVGKPTQIS